VNILPEQPRAGREAPGAAQAGGARRHRRLGELLLEDGVLTADQLEEALAAQANQPFGSRQKLGEVIVELGLADELRIARAVSNQLRLRFVTLDELLSVPESVTRLLSRQLADRHQAVAIAKEGGTITVALGDPTNVLALDDIRLLTRATSIRAAVATMSDLKEAVARLYSGSDAASHVLESFGELDELDADELLGGDEEGDVDGESAPVVRLVSAILSEALHNRASDIHIEPQERDVRVRMRIDGLLRETTVVPKQLQGALTSRIKILSGMDIAQRRKPQDGRGQIRSSGLEADTRVSTMPTMHGETIVIRLLRKQRQKAISLVELGPEPDALASFQRAIRQPQGLVLLTGPTGSGKTSTLYAALYEVLRPDINIITLEDPVEMQIPGVSQMQVDERIDLTFAAGLRTALRQDPDVILVGEIRDPETAAIAMQASMTGHLVLSTLHTNDAPSAATRLIDMGVEPFLITSSLALVVAQRLARRPCERCVEPVGPNPDSLRRLGIGPEEMASARLVSGRGCPTCAHTGYEGRLALFEVMPVSRAIRELIVTGATESQVRTVALADGMRSLRADGLAKAMAGKTTLEEVLRVTPADHERAGAQGTLEEPEPRTNGNGRLDPLRAG
jgi:type IV pilus assembly protein PilB